jgi:hypothetical protein
MGFNIFVRCNLFDVYAECAHGHMVARKCGKMITHYFGSKFYFWMKKYNIVVIVFSFDFEGKMNYLIPLCVHEKECALKKYETKTLESFQPFASYK